MIEWPIVKLEDLSSNESGSIAIGPFGSRMKTDVYTHSGVPVIRGTNISSSRAWKGNWVYVSDQFADELPNCNVCEDDLVFPHRGAIGEVAIVPGDKPRYMLSTSLMKFRPDTEKVSPRFLFYYFRSATGRAEIMRFASQVGTPGIGQPLTSLRQFRVPIPPKDVQKRIANVLSSLDDKIETNQRMNETLEAMAESVFKDWFVDFGPARAKAEGRAQYLTSQIWGLFPDALDDEGNPVGWETRRLEDFMELSYGKSLPAKQRTPGDVPVYGSGGITGSHNQALIDGPVAIVGRKGTVGSLYWEDGPAFPIDTVFYVVPRIGSMLFNYHLLGSMPLSDMNTDAAVPGLNRGNAYRLEFALPSSDVLSVFDDVVGPLWAARNSNIRETQTLSATRDFLLTKLMSGDLRLREFDNATEAVA